MTKKSASLLGEYYLEIDPGTEFKEVGGRPMRMRAHEGRRGAEERHRAGLAGDMMASVGTLIPVMREILRMSGR